jgi:ATP-binding cassette, subfamily B, bacterial MsbA
LRACLVYGSGHLRAVFRSLAEASDGNAQTLSRLIREQTERHWREYLASFILMAVLAACVTATAYFIGSVVNATALTKDFRSVLATCALIIAIFLIKGFSQYAQAVLLTNAHASTTASYQKMLFDRWLHESIEHFSASHSSDTLNRFRLSTESASRAIDLTICAIGREGLSVIGLVAVMIYQDPLLSLGCCLAAPIFLAVARISRAKLGEVNLKSIRARSLMAEFLQETMRGMRLIKAFGLEKSVSARAYKRIESVCDADQTIGTLKWRLIPWFEALSGCIVALIILYGSYRIIFMQATPGALISFLAAFMLAYEPIKRLTGFPAEVSGALAGVRLLYETLDREPSEADDGGKPELVVKQGRIVVQGVSFAYQQGHAVLSELSLAAAPGELTALVGHSGSGKSTIFNLLLRLYEGYGGQITIDGQNIADVSRSSVRRNIAYLGQDAFLFYGTIEENIAVGQPGAARDRIIESARAANAHDFIMGFPLGYDTPVGENGLALSSGQRQRIAVARAFLKNAPIVLLDEPTTSLDTISEREVQRAIARLCKDRTTLVIAHRMHTIVDSSTIYVIGDGKVLESGDHATLLRGGSTYQALQAELVD